MEKATREAKQNTSWVHPNEEYDRGVREFIGHVLAPRQNERFLSDFAQFAERTLDFGLFNSLGQVVLKLTSPGVPDFYQGQELWDFSLVDPDNRRPVDFSRRQQLLEDLASLDARELSALARQLALHPHDDRLKLLVTWRLLQLRQQHQELFTRGGYVPLDVHVGGRPPIGESIHAASRRGLPAHQAQRRHRRTNSRERRGARCAVSLHHQPARGRGAAAQQDARDQSSEARWGWRHGRTPFLLPP